MSNSSKQITKGFILAAGFGKRMMPLTADKPKPMVAVQGKPMIDHIIGSYEAFGISTIVVNTHYNAEILEQHLGALPSKADILISHEEDILETGGGISHALPLMQRADFFVSSGDSYLEDAPAAMRKMQEYWDSEKMDILILLQDIKAMTLTQGVGDYDLDDNGRAIRSKDKTGRYMFTSLRINAPHIFDDAPAGPYSYLELLDRAQSAGRLYGIVHHAQWHHISTPDDVARLNDAAEGQ